MLGSIIGGFVWDSMGVSATFLTGVIACCVGIFLCLLLKRTLTLPTRKIKIAA
jgi:predicted MFS family arabinose efflux permease